jgi:hypothetical protein
MKDIIDFKEIKSIIEQISKISIGTDMESSNNMVVKLSPESLACQVSKTCFFSLSCDRTHSKSNTFFQRI